MHGPQSWIVRIECHDDTRLWRHQHGVAHRAGETLAVDLDHLKLVSVQMHRVGHGRPVLEHQLNALTLGDWQRRTGKRAQANH
jgi:hypothetical protein